MIHVLQFINANMLEGNELVMREENINNRLMPGHIDRSSHICFEKGFKHFQLLIPRQCQVTIKRVRFPGLHGGASTV